jgi:DNA-directed RNA polymerase subunit alpha
MIEQLKAIVGFEELPNNSKALEEKQVSESVANPVGQESVIDPDVLKTRIEELGLSVRTVNALSAANIRTLGGLAKKKESEILEISGLGVKGMQEIKKALSSFGIELKR